MRTPSNQLPGDSPTFHIFQRIAHVRYNKVWLGSQAFFQYLVLYSLCSSLFRELREWSHEKFAILNLKPRSHVRIFYIKIYRSWAIVNEKVTLLVPSLSSERERTCVVLLGRRIFVFFLFKWAFLPLFDSFAIYTLTNQSVVICNTEVKIKNSSSLALKKHFKNSNILKIFSMQTLHLSVTKLIDTA